MSYYTINFRKLQNCNFLLNDKTDNKEESETSEITRLYKCRKCME